MQEALDQTFNEGDLQSRQQLDQDQHEHDGYRNQNFNPRSHTRSKKSQLAELDYRHYSRNNSPPLEYPESERDISSYQIMVQQQNQVSEKQIPVLKSSLDKEKLGKKVSIQLEQKSNKQSVQIASIQKHKFSQSQKKISFQPPGGEQELHPINEEFKKKMENLKIERFALMWMNLLDCFRFNKFTQQQLNLVGDKAVNHLSVQFICFQLLKTNIIQQFYFLIYFMQFSQHINSHQNLHEKRISALDYQKIKQLQMNSKSLFKSIKKPFLYLKRVWWDKVISPFNPLSIFMDFLTIMIITVDVMMITWTTFYGLSLDFMVFEFCSFAHFLIFILSRFHIGFYNQGKISLDKHEITMRYLKNSFILDFIGINSLLIYIITENQYVRIVNFARIGALRESFNKIEYLLYNYGIASHSYTLFKLVLNIMIISHFLGVAYHILNLIEIYLGEEQSWLQKNGFDQQRWLNQYAESVYWAVATLMLIGAKGDTLAETIFTTSVLFITVGIFGYLISSINKLIILLGQIIDDINRKQKEYNKDFRIINRYMRNKGISSKIQAEVRTAIENQYNSKELMEDNSEAQQIIENLPENVRENIRLQINLEILDRFPIFKKTFSQNLLNKMSTIMEEKSYVENEVIFDLESEQYYLYFVTSGTIKLQQSFAFQSKFQTIKVLKHFCILGDIEFFTNQKYSYKAICSTFSTISKISLIDFLDIIKDEPQDLEKYMMMRDLLSHHGKTICFSLQIYNNVLLITYLLIIKCKKNVFYPRSCLICDCPSHLEQNCSQIHYNPKRLLVIGKYNYNVPQEETIHMIRKVFRTHDSLYYLDRLYEVYLAFQDDPVVREYK